MKKIIVGIILFVIALLPLTVLAEDVKYESSNLVDTLKDESIDADLSNYKESDNQINIYMFRGHGCSFCRSFLQYVSTIVPDYGKYFKLVSYEVWNNEDNQSLLDNVSAMLNQKAEGVPYIIIGDKVFPGYSEEYNEDIKTAITDLYNSSEKYDAIEAVKEYVPANNDLDSDVTSINNDSSEKKNTNTLVTILCIASLIGVVGSITYTYVEYKKLNNKIDSVNKKSKK